MSSKCICQVVAVSVFVYLPSFICIWTCVLVKAVIVFQFVHLPRSWLNLYLFICQALDVFKSVYLSRLWLTRCAKMTRRLLLKETGSLQPWWEQSLESLTMSHYKYNVCTFQVLDRLCLVLFTIFTALATIIVLMAAPHVKVKWFGIFVVCNLGCYLVFWFCNNTCAHDSPPCFSRVIVEDSSAFNLLLHSQFKTFCNNLFEHW